MNELDEYKSEIEAEEEIKNPIDFGIQLNNNSTEKKKSKKEKNKYQSDEELEKELNNLL